MAWKQLVTPNINVPGQSGGCLAYVDDGVNPPYRQPTAQASWDYNVATNVAHPNEEPPNNVWVPIYYSIDNGPWAGYGHVAWFYSNGTTTKIYDSEFACGNRTTPYSSGAELLRYMGWQMRYLGWSESLDGLRIVSNDGKPTPPSPGGQYTGGALTNAGNTISQDNIRLVISSARKYNIKPSFLIAQMFVESHWGNPNISAVGSIDNNWSGISEPFHAPAELGISMSRGTARPSNEGGYYVHFTTMGDFFKAYSFILSKSNGLYNVEGTTTIEAYCKGLFRVGGANADYAASGYEHYLSMLVPTYNAINQQNPGKLQLIDSSNDDNKQEGEIEMILYKVNDKKSKMNGSIWMFNGEQLTRLDGVSAAKFAQNFKTTV